MVVTTQSSYGIYLHTLNEHSGAASSVTISPDGQTLASGIWDNTIKVWSISAGRLLHTPSEDLPTSPGFLDSFEDAFESMENPIYVTINPNGQTLISGSRSGVIKLWNLATGKELGTLTKD